MRPLISFKLFDRYVQGFNKMLQVSKEMITLNGRLLLELAILESYVKLMVLRKIDELERKFPIMAEHYKYMRWEELQDDSIENCFFNVIRSGLKNGNLLV